MRRFLRKLVTANKDELAFRSREAAALGLEALRFAAGSARFDARRLGTRLSPTSNHITRAIEALRRSDSRNAQTALIQHYRAAPRRFVLHPNDRLPLAAAINRQFVDAAADAEARCAKLLGGSFDLLGYTGLAFGPADAPDWHVDPVHEKRAPQSFYARVPYLDPVVGDHKVIWELNRHQHWLTLGRAAWLTGNTDARRLFASQLRSWLLSNPPLTGVNWASMLELAFRMLSWTWAVQFFVAIDDENDGEPWLVDLLTALDEQAEHVARHLSAYFSPNTHLLGEALALYIVGTVFPELSAAAQWRTLGRRVLLDETRAQVHADGGHAELSAHYHRYALDFYLLALRVAQINHDPAADRFAVTVSGMAEFCRGLADDSGFLPAIGDDDGGQLLPMCGRRPADATDTLSLAACLLGRPDLALSSPPEEVFWMTAADPALLSAGRPVSHDEATPPARLFAESGYAVLRSATSRAVVDVGPHGFLNGGHAHADALSLVLSTQGLPFLIDPGTATYTMDEALRNRLRSTAMHNTLTLDARPQSEPRGPFHWVSQAQARTDCWRPHRDCDYVEGSHDGYAPAVHRRGVLRLGSELWLLVDHVLSSHSHRADLHWHVDPSWELEARDAASVFTHHSGARAVLTSTCATSDHHFGDAAGLGWTSPLYGQLVPSWTVRSSQVLTGVGSIVTAIDVTGSEGLGIAEAPISVRQDDGWHRVGVRVQNDEQVVVALFSTAPATNPSQANADDTPPDTPVRLAAAVELPEGRLVTDARVAAVQLRKGLVTALHLIDATRAQWSGAQAFVTAAAEAATDLHLDHAAIERLSQMPSPVA